MHEVWNKTDDKLILLRRKLLYWKEVSSRDSCGFVVGQSSSVTALTLFLPPQLHRFLRDFLTRCSRAAQQMNAMLPWTLRCGTQPVGAGVAGQFPSSWGNPPLGCNCMLQGGLQHPASAGKGVPPTFLEHGHFQKNFQGCTNTTEPSGLKSN